MRAGKLFAYPAGILLALLGTLFSNFSFGQKAVDVDLVSGAAKVHIPLYTIKRGDIAVPLSLIYTGGNGIKVEDYDQRVGLGWSLIAEGSITRIVKGYPDDVQNQAGSSKPLIKGWIRSTGIGSAVENFTISNDGNSGTCTDDVSDYNYMNTNFSDNYDTEPDVFAVNAPGLSLSFMFDKNKNIKVIPYQDVNITYTTDGNGEISGFTVINSDGVKYVFDKGMASSHYISDSWTVSNLPAFRRNYVYYSFDQFYPKVDYNWKWNINYIEDTKGNQVIFGYDLTSEGPSPKANEKTEIIKYNSGSYVKDYLYTTTSTKYTQRLKSISVLTEDVITNFVTLSWETSTSDARLARLDIIKDGLAITFGYTRRFNKLMAENQWGRYFLKSLVFARNVCDDLGGYKFSYYGVNDDTSPYYSYITTADSITNAQDYWGYFNAQVGNTNLNPPIWVYPDNSSVERFRIFPIPYYGGNVVELTGANRNPSDTAARNGALYRLTYPTGGVTQIDYEGNDYYDPDVSGAVKGGGIRVKKITHNDGLNTNQVIQYEYNDPSTGVTTGRATALPAFAFHFPNSTSYGTLADKIKNTTYRTLYDISDESKQIIYGKVTVKQSGNGKSVYYYNTNATWRSAATANWNETVSYAALRLTSAGSPCATILPVELVNGKHSYPFPQNPNYDFERGLLTKVEHYNEAGTLVTEEDYTYTPSHSQPVFISALKFDDVGTVRSYAKYNALTAFTNLPSTVATKTYNSSSPGSGVYTSTSRSLFYESSAHKLPTKIERQNSDGTTLITRTKYAKDYSTTGSGDATEQAIHNLKALNKNTVVESYNSILSGGTEKVISADLTVFKAFYNPTYMLNMYLPYQSWKFNSSAGTTGFTPSTISSGNFTKHSGYLKLKTIEEHDMNGDPIYMTDNSRMPTTVLTQPYNDVRTGEIKNAKASEIIYSSFDFSPSQVGVGWGGNTYVEPGRASWRALNFQPSTTLTRQVDNATTNKNIVFSCWTANAVSSGTITVSIVGNTTNNYTISFSTGSAWKYHQLIIPKPASVNNFTVNISTSAAIHMDDILLYPDNADPKVYSYTLKKYGLLPGQTNLYYSQILQTAQTGLNGLGSIMEYDGLGRAAILRNQDNNIIEVKQYRKAHYWPAISMDTITWATPVYKNTAHTFSSGVSGVSCITAGVQYKWNFGDGTGDVFSTTGYISHTYANTGTYTITCTLYVAGLATVSYTTPTGVTVSNPPPPPVYPTFCTAGIVEYTLQETCILYYCTGLTSICSETKFKLQSVPGYSLTDVDAVSWEKAPIGTESWSTVGYGTQYTQSFNAATTGSYKIRCRVLMTDGATGVSTHFNVYNNGPM